MKYLVLLVALAGCATPIYKSAYIIADKEAGQCNNQCMANYNSCVAPFAGGDRGIIGLNNIYRCNDAYNQCNEINCQLKPQ